MNVLFSLSCVAVATLCAVAPGGALAQGADGFPSRPVRIIVPTPAGGPSDTAARLLAQALAATWKQPVIVENKAGAGGSIAAQAVMSAPPDGYTLLWAQASMAGMPMVQKNAPYRNLNEWVPVANVVNFGYALFVNKDLPVNSVAELASYGRAHPGQLSYATGTLGEYMAGAHMLKFMDVKAVRVPYKGGAQLMPDLISGQVQVNLGPILSGLQHVKAGKLKMLATLLPQRIALLPDVPTAAELGLPGADMPTWNAVFAPARTAREVVAKVSDDIAQALRSPAIRASFEQQGAVPLGSTPQQLAEAVEAATTAWAAFVRDHDIPQE